MGIYGVSSKHSFGKWEHMVYVFDNEASAQEWLHTEEYDFRERELMTEGEVIELVGDEAVKYAIAL